MRTDSEHLFYVSCPACGRQISEPFTRRAPAVHIHADGSRACRIVVIPRGQSHEVRPVPQVVTLEEALEGALMECAA